MKKYDVTCPVCGHKNVGLFLEETDGWMECEHCRQVSRSGYSKDAVRIPAFAVNDLARPLAAGA